MVSPQLNIRLWFISPGLTLMIISYFYCSTGFFSSFDIASFPAENWIRRDRHDRISHSKPALFSGEISTVKPMEKTDPNTL